MNSVKSELVSREEHTEVLHETEEGLIEMGAVTETQGFIVGGKMDSGIGAVWY